MKRFLLGLVAILTGILGGALVFAGLVMLVPVYVAFISGTLLGHFVLLGGLLVITISGGLWSVRK